MDKCIFEFFNKCAALKIKKCDKCKFYKSQKEYECTRNGFVEKRKETK